MIYKKEYGKITSIYKDQNLANELGIVIGAITGSQEVINYAASEKGGGQFNMCTALDELIESGREEGKEKILTEIIRKNLADNKTPEEIAAVLYMDISEVQKIINNLKKNS